MKYFKYLLIFLFIPFINCKNSSSSPSEKVNTPEKIESAVPEIKQPIPKKSTEDFALPSEEGGINYWVDNKCSRAIPTSTIKKEHQVNGYKFKLNPQQGYGKETMFLENGYSLDVTSKGCNSIILTYSYFLPASDLDVSNSMAVSEKVLELVKMTSEMSAAPIDFKSKISPLQMAVEQIGPFEIGNEFILSETGGTLKFSIERLETKNKKVFLVYYFSKDQE